VAICALATVVMAGCGGGGSGSSGGGDSGFVGTIYYQVAAADLDGDGLTDLATIAAVYTAAGTSAELQVLLQDPSNVGHFIVAQHLPLSTVGGALALAYLDGDNRIDIAVTEPGHGNDQVRIFLQDANPAHFSLADTRPTSSGLTRIEIADIDLDGAPDLVLAVGNGVLGLRQDPAALGTFPSQTSIDSSQSPDSAQRVQYQSLSVGDLNDDGESDIAAVRIATKPEVYFQSGTTAAAFTPLRVGMSLAEPEAIVVADIDHDGFNDLAATGNSGYLGDPIARVVLQDPAHPGTFLGAVVVKITDSGDPRAIRVADVTGDGLPDLLIGKSYVDYGFVEVLEQTGPPLDFHWIGAFPDLKLIHNDGNLSSMAVADLNDDGLLDIAVVDGELSCLFNDAANPGHFLAAVRAIR
jgi:hypothetical protein